MSRWLLVALVALAACGRDDASRPATAAADAPATELAIEPPPLVLPVFGCVSEAAAVAPSPPEQLRVAATKVRAPARRVVWADADAPRLPVGDARFGAMMADPLDGVPTLFSVDDDDATFLTNLGRFRIIDGVLAWRDHVPPSVCEECSPGGTYRTRHECGELEVERVTDRARLLSIRAPQLDCWSTRRNHGGDSYVSWLDDETLLVTYVSVGRNVRPARTVVWDVPRCQRLREVSQVHWDLPWLFRADPAPRDHLFEPRPPRSSTIAVHARDTEITVAGDLLAITPDGTRLAILDGDGWVIHFVDRRGAGYRVRLDTRSVPYDLGLSDSGRYAVWTDGPAWKSIDLETGTIYEQAQPASAAPAP